MSSSPARVAKTSKSVGGYGQDRRRGSLKIAAGTGFDPKRWDDRVIFDLPRGHGIHLDDFVGMAFVIVGITVLWFSPRRRERGRT